MRHIMAFAMISFSRWLRELAPPSAPLGVEGGESLSTLPAIVVVLRLTKRWKGINWEGLRELNVLSACGWQSYLRKWVVGRRLMLSVRRKNNAVVQVGSCD